MHSSPIYLFLVFFASVIAGVMNSVAGGGRLVAFPALLFAGVPPIVANATSSLGVWPSLAASSWVYRKYIDTPRRTLILLIVMSVVGSLLGAWLLLHTPARFFERLIPPLLIFAAILFSFSGHIRRMADRMAIPAGYLAAMAVIGQFVIAIYGGYFGAGMGVLLLSLYSLTLNTKIHAMNGLRTFCAMATITTSVTVFILGHEIDWLFAAIVAVGAILGSTAGAISMRRLSPILARRMVLVIAWGMTLVYVAKMVI
ncbi:MAG TPA: sulfite exporter TauE/SafE family protein [Candidatus Dormibacteraeota bacterium]|nr:sulfite exporter TauE/SafE family protein [Candidatus Dormibacteraeota bacterium]